MAADEAATSAEPSAAVEAAAAGAEAASASKTDAATAEAADEAAASASKTDAAAAEAADEAMPSPTAPAAALGPAAAAAGAGQEGERRVLGVTIYEEAIGRFRNGHGQRCDRCFHRLTSSVCRASFVSRAQ